MEEEHTDGVVFGVYMRKITKPGYALCLWCDAPVNYGGKGLSSIKQHASTDVHQANRKTRETNFRLLKIYFFKCINSLSYAVFEVI